jgi:putative secretion ATPase (PEP-CTERM system associated)
MFDDFYGLEARPFQLTPDPAFYFESLTHRKALSYLGYGLAQGEGFVVITGEVGAGKSTLVAHLMATIDPEQLTAAQVVTSALDGEEIVHVVAQAFGLEVSGHDKATALGMIEQFLQAEARAGRRCLLIVDESQNLEVGAIEELRMLSNFQLGAHPLLQTLLLGQPEFRELLLESPELEQLRQRVIATHHLEAMHADEVQPYVEYRMSRAGWQGYPSFDEHLFAEIHVATGGIPRRINQVVNRLLLLGAVEQRDRIDGAMLAQVLGELNEDGTIALVSPQPAKSRAAAMQDGAPAYVTVPPAEHDPAVTHAAIAAAAAAAVESAIAERDAQIQELQQAVIELANSVEEREEARQSTHAELVAAIDEQIAAINTRLTEQDRTIRHALTMIIEWIESGEGARAAA